MTKTKKAVKAEKPAKKEKKVGPKKVTEPKNKIGHNSGEVVPGVVSLLDELLGFYEQKKSIGKAERDLRNKAKTEFGITANVLSEELKKRKMDPDVRVQYEVGQEDIKKMTGYQASLDFDGAQPTETSIRAQKTEEELEQMGTNEGYEAGDEESREDSFSVEDDEESEDDEEMPSANYEEEDEDEEEATALPPSTRRRA